MDGATQKYSDLHKPWYHDVRSYFLPILEEEFVSFPKNCEHNKANSSDKVYKTKPAHVKKHSIRIPEEYLPVHKPINFLLR